MTLILKIAIPCPLRLHFDYLADNLEINWQAGLRVRVPFGSRQVVGVVLNTKISTDEDDLSKLKSILECLDEQPLIPADLLSLTQWLSDYYHHPIGDCLQAVLPA